MAETKPQDTTMFIGQALQSLASMKEKTAAVSDDALPTESPYSSKPIKLKFSCNFVITVPRGIIKKYPKLETACKGDTLRFTSLAPPQAHSLVHFLYTGAWQRLEPAGRDTDAKLMNAIDDCLMVYFVAEKYNIDALTQLAISDFIQLAEPLNIVDMFLILEANQYTLDEIPHLFANYLAEKAAMDDGKVTQLDLDEICEANNKKRSIAAIFLETIVSMRLDLQKYQKMHGPLP